MFSLARSTMAPRQILTQVSRSFSTTRATSDFARMQLLGRLVADPEVRTTRAGKEYILYTLATSDPTGATGENGSEAPQSTSYHRIFAFNEKAVERLQKYTKGSTLIVDAEFRVQKTEPAADGSVPAGDSYLVQHKSAQLVKKPLSQVQQD